MLKNRLIEESLKMKKNHFRLENAIAKFNILGLWEKLETLENSGWHSYYFFTENELEINLYVWNMNESIDDIEYMEERINESKILGELKDVKIVYDETTGEKKWTACINADNVVIKLKIETICRGEEVVEEIYHPERIETVTTYKCKDKVYIEKGGT